MGDKEVLKWLNNIDFVIAPNAPFNAKGLKEPLLKALTHEDIIYLINKGLSNGNDLDKVASKLNCSESEKFKMLCQKIYLRSQVSGRAGVTLSRICQAFPDETLDVLLVSPNIGPVTLDECIRASGRPEFSTIARHTVCASIIPRCVEERAEALNVIMMASMLFADKVNKNAWWLSRSGRQKLHGQFDFFRKSYYSSAWDSERVPLCIKYGVLDNDLKLTEAWVSTAEAATAYLKTNYKCALANEAPDAVIVRDY